MDRRIILLSGPVASGKTTLATKLVKQFSLKILRTRAWLKSALEDGGRPGRADLQREGEQLDQETNGTWVLKGLDRDLRGTKSSEGVVIDSVRTEEQIAAIRNAYGTSVTHIHLTAPMPALGQRYEERQQESAIPDSMTYEDVRRNNVECKVGSLHSIADVVVDTGQCTQEDVLVRVASRLGLYGTTNAGYVDVIVGGQYGSEGKGQIAAFLSGEYDLLIRVGGPNAGHTVFELPTPYTHHQLPSGTRRNESARLLIGPGAVLDVDKLLVEIADCNVDVDRLGIDGAAMVISKEDKATEKELVAGIGSTGQGGGAALSRRILERHSESVRLAKDIPELNPYICSALEVIEEILAGNGRICLEGTQGTGLSLYHGPYPYVTSRDTTVAGCLAEAGVPPSNVRRVIMVCRTYPIRVQSPVGGTSGPMSQEISLEDIAERSGLELDELERTERTSTTDRERRIGEFDWKQLRRSTLLNRPTDIALTFTDYLTIANRAAKRFDQLEPNTINVIEEIERVSQARVSLVGTGFNPRSIIDRRAW